MFVFGDQRFGLLDLFLALFGRSRQSVDLGRDVGNAGFETGYFVFEILHFKRPLTLDLVDFVDFRVDFLELVQRDDLFLYGIVVRFVVFSAGCRHICKKFLKLNNLPGLSNVHSCELQK